MAVTAELQNQWEAFLKLVQVREPKFHEHLKNARIKELTRYNVVLYAPDPDELREIEVGLKVYHDRIVEFVPLIFMENRGIKIELAPKGEWRDPEPEPAPSQPAPAVPSPAPSADLNDLVRVMEASIRQKVEASVRQQIEAEAGHSRKTEEEQRVSLETEIQKAKEDFERESGNRRLAARAALTAKGDKTLGQLMDAWHRAQLTGEGGHPWEEVQKRLLELLDTTIQMTHS